MLQPDGQTLMHKTDVPYDPVKAHEYYLRVRKLKGRKKGATPDPAGRRIVRHPTRNGQRQKADAAEAVKRISSKIDKLERELKLRVAAQKKAQRDAAKPATASDKSKKARDAKQYRDKHKQELKTKAKQAAAKTPDGKAKADKHKQSIDELKGTIESLKKKLAAAVARQRALG